MKMRIPKFKDISFWALVIFSFIGAILGGVLVHEEIHRYDLRNYVDPEGDNQIIMFPKAQEGDSAFTTAFAMYRFETIAGSYEEVKRLQTISEIRAYTAFFIIIGIYFIFLFKIFDDRAKEKGYEQAMETIYGKVPDELPPLPEEFSTYLSEGRPQDLNSRL